MQKSKFLALLGILAVLAILFGCPVQNDDNGTSDQTQTNTSSSSSSSDNSSSSSSSDDSSSSSSSSSDDSSSSSSSSDDSSSSSDDNHQVQAPALSEFVGTWTTSLGETYVITADKFYNYSSQNTTATPFYTWSIEDQTGDGTNADVLYVYGKVTQLGTAVYYGMEWPASGTIGHYSAVYLKKIDANNINICCAYGDNTSDNASLDYVKTNFTDANNYFGNKSGVYTKVTALPELADYVGTWKSDIPAPYDDWFIINNDNVLVYYADGDPTNDLNYAGVVESADVSGDYIFLNMKVLQDGFYTMATDSYARIGLEKKSSATSVGMSTGGFYDSNTSYFDCTADTIDNLKTKFNIETGAYTYFGEYTKQ